MLAAIAVLSYLFGSIPVGWLVGRARGVDLFAAGSGNIGATNAARVLGRNAGLLVFLLDLLKGALPVLAVTQLSESPIAAKEMAKVVAAAAVFVGHLFPVFLRFRGGKGVATGAGTVLVLAPIPAMAAVATWLLVVLASRFVSLASIAAVTILVAVRLLTVMLSEVTWPATSYCLVGTLLVIARHRTNMVRLIHGTENRIGDGPMRQSLLRVLHVLAVGFWFGGAAFFNFVVAPSLFRSYADVVNTAPSDRTAYQPLGLPEATPEIRNQLALALAGAGVGPIFPKYFLMMTLCGVTAFITALAWRSEGRLHYRRAVVAFVALATVLAGWPLSNMVAELRMLRFDPDRAIANTAKADFALTHLVSLGLSTLTVLLAGVLLILAAWLPRATDDVKAN